MATWLIGIGAVMVVVVLYWAMVDYLLDTFGPPPGQWPPRRDGSPA
jgi:hypothetical protein